MFHRFETKEYFMKRNFGWFFGFAIMVMMAIFTMTACDTGNSSPETYKIGDTGPAGGIVFYDKGTTSDGWRYLEAAPASTVFSPSNYVRHNSDHLNDLIGGTSTAIGSGKRNTEIILEKFLDWEEPDEYQSGRKAAARLCADLSYGGYNDCFLPSKDELNAMYLSLGDTGLEEGALVDWDNYGKGKENWGGWANKHCWSSSESGNDEAWVQGLKSGSQFTALKKYEHMVRAVRAF
jgi:hypothetical protein